MKMLAPQRGMVLVVALVLVLMMTTLALGLMSFANREVKQVDLAGSTDALRSDAEACVEEALHWLEIQGVAGPPCESQSIGSQCGSTFTRSMSDWTVAGDNALSQSRAGAASYSCQITVASRETLDGGSGTGSEIGQSSSYNSVATSTKYLYRVTSSATDTNGGKFDLEVVAAMVY